MKMVNSTYLSLRVLRNNKIQNIQLNNTNLNTFHDYLIKQVVKEAIERTNAEWGPPPSPFCFFIMGSGGRFEQGIWSDQDHGIVFEKNSEEAEQYFLKLGKEISEGLFITGYDRCDGEVMASNPLWCKSRVEWEEQLTRWIQEATWDSIRHLLIFIDSRPIYGNGEHIYYLKKWAHEKVHERTLLFRILENTMHLKKGTNVLGQLLVETNGPYSGALNVKETAFLPYVNSIRLLAMKENIFTTSTLSRLKNLPEHVMSIQDQKLYEEQFLSLLQLRLLYGQHDNYEAGHYLQVEKLNKRQINELKDILKNGQKLHRYTRKLIEKGCKKCE